MPGAQSVWFLDPVEHDEPSGQASHSLALTRPVALEYVPARHGSAAAAPLRQKLPVVHSWHAVSPGPS